MMLSAPPSCSLINLTRALFRRPSKTKSLIVSALRLVIPFLPLKPLLLLLPCPLHQLKQLSVTSVECLAMCRQTATSSRLLRRRQKKQCKHVATAHVVQNTRRSADTFCCRVCRKSKSSLFH